MSYSNFKKNVDLSPGELTQEEYNVISKVMEKRSDKEREDRLENLKYKMCKTKTQMAEYGILRRLCKFAQLKQELIQRGFSVTQPEKGKLVISYPNDQ